MTGTNPVHAYRSAKPEDGSSVPCLARVAQRESARE